MGGIRSRSGGHAAGMAKQAVAASSTWVDESGVRQPGGEAHAWLPGTNQTACGLPLSRARLSGFPHVPFDFRRSDKPTATDQIGHICPRCLAATGHRRDDKGWRRHSPRP